MSDNYRNGLPQQPRVTNQRASLNQKNGKPVVSARRKISKTREAPNDRVVKSGFVYDPSIHTTTTKGGLSTRKIWAIIVALPATIFGLLALCHIFLSLCQS